ncbi:MAG TPA: aminomethyl-transferring glycine dehydrogenase subunit GcvPA [Synergistales bacterium]|nr:aminomethyl-transferring glycine dehydrogenase subunit GcvPA [Synergistales bacterium]HPC75397.1 aminomethyl-transferring glycine dehydrogenase subunit GcvPA [Synergistales bacterium]HRS48166.1 aminomethyl-transferring glycine dehydrogenase subunit GcvPA [Thermovirgaceae bacterium]HRU90640.1 aminomethyl-transferring glycine dehydrogenase subunit GcvPA [Thermovirgaceae bacterium]
MKGKKRVYPYIPNSEPRVREAMLKEIGVDSVDDLLGDIPREIRMRSKMNLPEPFTAEADLKRHVEGILSRNIAVGEYLSFLGAGCYDHHVPAVVDEVIGRSEFLTAYAGEPYEDHGRFQVLFEYQSMMAELLDFDVCNVPTYDGAQAAGTSLRMASRVTGRKKALLAGNMNPDRLRVVRTYLDPVMTVEMFGWDRSSGLLDLEDLASKMSEEVAAVYFENPSYLGTIEDQGGRAARTAHEAGALMVVFTDPSTLGVLEPPSRYGADIACGDIQPLGIHMNYGGGLGGFICTKGEGRFVEEYPSRLFGIAPTREKEWGFGDVAWERTSFANRETAKEFVGTHAALWGVAAAAYLASMGPEGMADLGKVILQRSLYARKVLGEVPGVSTEKPSGVSFKEFVVDFGKSGHDVAGINEKLLARGIYGGKDLSGEFPELGQSALYCVTEKTSKNDIDRLAEALSEILR